MTIGKDSTSEILWAGREKLNLGGLYGLGYTCRVNYSKDEDPVMSISYLHTEILLLQLM